MNVTCFCLTKNCKYPMEKNGGGIITLWMSVAVAVLVAVMNIRRDKMMIKKSEKEQEFRKIKIKMN